MKRAVSLTAVIGPGAGPLRWYEAAKLNRFECGVFQGFSVSFFETIELIVDTAFASSAAGL
jgi:hypothetical protein